MCGGFGFFFVCVFGVGRREVCHLMPSYHASQLHSWLPLQNVAFLFSAWVPEFLDANVLAF